MPRVPDAHHPPQVYRRPQVFCATVPDGDWRACGREPTLVKRDLGDESAAVAGCPPEMRGEPDAESRESQDDSVRGQRLEALERYAAMSWDYETWLADARAVKQPG